MPQASLKPKYAYIDNEVLQSLLRGTAMIRRHSQGMTGVDNRRELFEAVFKLEQTGEGVDGRR